MLTLTHPKQSKIESVTHASLKNHSATKHVERLQGIFQIGKSMSITVDRVSAAQTHNSANAVNGFA